MSEDMFSDVAAHFFPINVAQHGKKAFMPYANSEGPEERAHPYCLIWSSFVRRHIIQYPLVL